MVPLASAVKHLPLPVSSTPLSSPPSVEPRKCLAPILDSTEERCPEENHACHEDKCVEPEQECADICLTMTARRRLQDMFNTWRKNLGLKAYGLVPTPPRSWPRMFELVDGFSDSPEQLHDGLWVATSSPIAGMNITSGDMIGDVDLPVKYTATPRPWLPVGSRRHALLVLALSSWRGAAAHAAKTSSLRCRRSGQGLPHAHCIESVLG